MSSSFVPLSKERIGNICSTLVVPGKGSGGVPDAVDADERDEGEVEPVDVVEEEGW